MSFCWKGPIYSGIVIWHNGFISYWTSKQQSSMFILASSNKNQFNAFHGLVQQIKPLKLYLLIRVIAHLKASQYWK